MNERDRLDSLLSLIITLLAGALFVIWLSACANEPDYRRAWVGKWYTVDESSTKFEFKENGTWQSDKNSGTYSVAENTYKFTYRKGNGSRFNTGTWEKFDNKLILYVDLEAIPSGANMQIWKPPEREAIVFTADPFADLDSDLDFSQAD